MKIIIAFISIYVTGYITCFASVSLSGFSTIEYATLDTYLPVESYFDMKIKSHVGVGVGGKVMIPIGDTFYIETGIGKVLFINEFDYTFYDDSGNKIGIGYNSSLFASVVTIIPFKLGYTVINKNLKPFRFKFRLFSEIIYSNHQSISNWDYIYIPSDSSLSNRDYATYDGQKRITFNTKRSNTISIIPGATLELVFLPLFEKGPFNMVPFIKLDVGYIGINSYQETFNFELIDGNFESTNSPKGVMVNLGVGLQL